jgi:hypothetical protein
MKATSEPLQRYTLRRPKDAADYMAKDSDGQWVKYDDLKADRASSGATTQAVRMLTPREIELLREIRLHAQFGLNEGWQREARNLLLELEQYYRTIPPSGEIGGV